MGITKEHLIKTGFTKGKSGLLVYEINDEIEFIVKEKIIYITNGIEEMPLTSMDRTSLERLKHFLKEFKRANNRGDNKGSIQGTES